LITVVPQDNNTKHEVWFAACWWSCMHQTRYKAADDSIHLWIRDGCIQKRLRLNAVNDIIWHAFNSVCMPASKHLSCLCRCESKWTDGLLLIPIGKW